MPKKTLAARAPDDGVGHRIAEAILDFIGHIPQTDERKSRDPDNAARGVATAAATKAAIAAGTLALPPGPIGWLTILPELVAVWKIQAQMVADIAAIYGKKAFLTREQMLYCLSGTWRLRQFAILSPTLASAFFLDELLCARFKALLRRLAFA